MFRETKSYQDPNPNKRLKKYIHNNVLCDFFSLRRYKRSFKFPLHKTLVFTVTYNHHGYDGVLPQSSKMWTNRNPTRISATTSIKIKFFNLYMVLIIIILYCLGMRDYFLIVFTEIIENLVYLIQIHSFDVCINYTWFRKNKLIVSNFIFVKDILTDEIYTFDNIITSHNNLYNYVHKLKTIFGNCFS